MDLFPWGAVFAADEDGRITDPTPIFGRNSSPWRFVMADVSQTRFWQAASAKFVIARPILRASDRVLVDIEEEISRLCPLEQPIVIEAGYAPHLRSDDNINGRERLFLGWVETINIVGSARKVEVTMSCRDAMRFLIENKFSGQIYKDNMEMVARTGFDDVRRGAHPLSIAEMMQAFDPQGTYRQDPPGQRATRDSGKAKIMAWLVYAGSNGGCKPAPFAPWIDGGANDDSAVFQGSSRVIAQAQNALKGLEGFNIMNRFPLEVIKHVGSLEAEPREMWADIDTGRICWRQRVTLHQDRPWRFSFLVPANAPGHAVTTSRPTSRTETSVQHRTFNGTVLFATGSSTVGNANTHSLNGVLDSFIGELNRLTPQQRSSLLSNSAFRITVVGHASNLGNAASNQRLSDNRGRQTQQHVQRYLSQHGVQVPASRFSRSGAGTTQSSGLDARNNDQRFRSATVTIEAPIPTTVQINGVAHTTNQSPPALVKPNVEKFEIDWSTIGTISELIVINPTSGSNDPRNQGSGVVSVAGRLPDNRFNQQHISKAFPGIKNFTRRTRYIFDDTIRPDDVQNAKSLIDAMFRIWGRDLRAGTLTTPGNAQIRPGDAVQIFNFGLFHGQIFRAEAVRHVITARGARKGFRTTVSFAERDEARDEILKDVKRTIGEEGSFYITKNQIHSTTGQDASLDRTQVQGVSGADTRVDQ